MTMLFHAFRNCAAGNGLSQPCRSGVACEATTGSVAQQRNTVYAVTTTLISICTLFYGSLPVLIGNAAARCLARDRCIAALAT